MIEQNLNVHVNIVLRLPASRPASRPAGQPAIYHLVRQGLEHSLGKRSYTVVLHRSVGQKPDKEVGQILSVAHRRRAGGGRSPTIILDRLRSMYEDTFAGYVYHDTLFQLNRCANAIYDRQRAN